MFNAFGVLASSFEGEGSRGGVSSPFVEDRTDGMRNGGLMRKCYYDDRVGKLKSMHTLDWR